MTPHADAARLPDLLRRLPAIRDVRAVGSRARGEPTALSDWDFELETDAGRADEIAAALPDLLAPLVPLGMGWDPFGGQRTFMVLLPGPAKVDLVFPDPQPPYAGPWAVSAETLPRIEHHFWDWTLWLAAKRLRGRHTLVTDELQRMHDHLLRPLGVETAPASIEAAIDAFRAARERAAARFETVVDRRLEEAVLPAIRAHA